MSDVLLIIPKELRDQLFGPPHRRGPKTHDGEKQTEDEEDAGGLFDFPQSGERDLNLPYQCRRCVRGFHRSGH